MTLDELMSDGNYLPEFMRDFHDQKTLFKRIDEIVQARREKNKKSESSIDRLTDTGLINWIDANVYVIDFFLWYMARRGYTLQKCRKQGIEFVDLEKDLKDFTDREFASFAEFLKAESNATHDDHAGL